MPEIAGAHNTTVLDIRNNRRADVIAKKAALRNAPIHHEVYQELCNAVLHRQQWLTGLCKLVGNTLPPKEPESDDEPVETVGPESRFPLLPWNAEATHYDWVVPVAFTEIPCRGWNSSPSDWLQFISFLQGLRWMVDETARISYAELAILFLCQGFRIDACQDEFYTFKSLICCIKKWFGLLPRRGLLPLHPGTHDRIDHNAWGKTMPSGIVAGARPWRSNDDLTCLTSIASRVVRANLTAWEFAIREFFQ